MTVEERKALIWQTFGLQADHGSWRQAAIAEAQEKRDGEAADIRAFRDDVLVPACDQIRTELAAELACREVAFHVDLNGGRLAVTRGQDVELQVVFRVAFTIEGPRYLEFRASRPTRDENRYGTGRFMECPANSVTPDAIAEAVVTRWVWAVG